MLIIIRNSAMFSMFELTLKSTDHTKQKSVCINFLWNTCTEMH